ncbi:hypothetical protein BDR26DRAFT_915869 [Obelidium mucronatum]|nr:hypothetical protein BDR26DRAFT_915869 [Obelidium mucronatum]
MSIISVVTPPTAAQATPEKRDGLLRVRDLPPGYTYKSFKSSDWYDYSINLVTTAVIVTSEADCAGQTLSLGGFFFTYNDANKNCWPKNALSGFPDRSTLVPTSTNTFFEIPDRDFAGLFDLLPSNKRATSRLECAQICFQTPGCVVSTYVHSGTIQYDCALKAPSYTAGFDYITAGVIAQAPAVPVTARTEVLPPPTTVPEAVTSNLMTTSTGELILTEASRRTETASGTRTDKATTVTQTVGNRSTTPINLNSNTDASGLNLGLIFGIIAGILFAGGIIYWIYQRARGKEIAAKEDNNSPYHNLETIPTSLAENVIFPPAPKRKETSGDLFVVMEVAIAEAVKSTSRSAYAASILNLPRNVNDWSIDQATAWIAQCGGGIEGANRAKAQKINGRALIVLDMGVILDVVQCPTVGDSVVLNDAIMDLRAADGNELALPAYE